jgi:hypothetical protein
VSIILTVTAFGLMVQHAGSVTVHVPRECGVDARHTWNHAPVYMDLGAAWGVPEDREMRFSHTRRTLIQLPNEPPMLIAPPCAGVMHVQVNSTTLPGPLVYVWCKPDDPQPGMSCLLPAFWWSGIADINADGIANLADVLDFAANPYDWNMDGAVDAADYEQFFTAWMEAQ